MTQASAGSDVIVIGAGITGLATALALAERGVTVTVVERYHPGAMASGWTLAGVRQSGRDHAELALAQRAVDLWQVLDEHLDAPTGYRRTGNLRLARNAAEATIIRQLVETQGLAGLDIELLEAETLYAAIPALSRTVCCASLCHSDGQAESRATIAAYRAAAERCGVRILDNRSVQGLNLHGNSFHSLDTSSGRLAAGACLLATGIQTNELLAPLALQLPIKWARLTVLQTEPIPPLLVPVIGVANADLALRQQADGRLRMTSGAEFDHVFLDEDHGVPRVPVSPSSIETTRALIAAVLPVAGSTRITQHWGGLLDMTPDALPVIDRLPGIDGVFVAAGFSGHGFGIGPAVAETVAQLMLDGTTSLSIAAFAFERFSGRSSAVPELHG